MSLRLSLETYVQSKNKNVCIVRVETPTTILIGVAMFEFIEN
jgi:hypothetical protein